MFKYRFKQLLSERTLKIGLLTISLLVIIVSIAQAVELPTDTSAAFIQTSGPNTRLDVGDYYTNNRGAQEPHYMRVNIPCTWPATQTITFALFDPEIQEPDPDPALEPPLADDEIRDDAGNTILNPPNPNIQFADTATYTLVVLDDQNNIDRVVVPPISFTPSPTNSTNGLWVELVTFTPGTPNFGCGVYALASVTSDNDDNAWKLSVSYDPDCSVSLPGNPGSCAGIGQTQSDLLSNGNEQDDADGIPGTGDELLISADQLSYQHENDNPTTLTCQIFYHPVFEEDLPEVVFHDFDLDLDNATGRDSTIEHRSPSGVVYPGAGSNNESWNNASSPPPYPPQRGGDQIPIGPDDLGLWQTEICVNRLNQYIYEGQSDEIIFLQPPPAPKLIVSKDDGRTIVEAGEVLTYTIVFTNISDIDPWGPAAPGAAISVTITDQIPPYTTFRACQVNPPYTGPCVENPTGIVTARINEIVVAGASGTVDVTVRVNSDAPPGLLTDTVRLDYNGALLGIRYPPVTDIDIDEILPQPPTPTHTPTPVPTEPPEEEKEKPKPTNTPLPPTVAPTPTATPTPVVLYLPETGLREASPPGPGSILLWPGMVLLVVSIVGLLFMRRKLR